jgi:hypothetical protein
LKKENNDKKTEVLYKTAVETRPFKLFTHNIVTLLISDTLDDADIPNIL